MTQIKYIKEQYEKEEKSLREISRMTGYSFQTVRKYAYEDNWNAEHLPNVEPWKHPVLGPYIETIDRWLEENLKAPQKQRHTAMRIHARLVEECGFTSNYSCVKLKNIYLVYFFQDFLNLSSFPFKEQPFL